MKVLREYFCTWGTPEELTSDGGSAYVAAATKRFLSDWGVRHRVSTAYNPHANLRAETGVKSMKRLIARNTGVRGSLDTDSLAMALLQYRNTPDRDTGRSPAQVLFCRKLRDAVPVNREDLKIRPEWVLTSQAREAALARRHEVRRQELSEHTRPLGPLSVGAVVQVQNQAGPHRNKWDHSGTVVEALGHDAYHVKMDGSGRVTKRNRRFLREIVPYTRVIAARQQDTVDSSVLGSTDVTKSNYEGSGVPAVEPVYDDGGAASSGAVGAGGTHVRGDGRVTSVLQRDPSNIQGEVLGGPVRTNGSVLGTRPRRGLVTSSTLIDEGLDDIHAASTIEGSDDTHTPRKYDLRPRKMLTKKS